MFGIGVGIRVGGRTAVSSGGGYDPAAAAFFAATGITGATEQQAVNTLVTSLKSAGLWSKMKAVYPFVTDNRNLLSYTEDFGNAYYTKQNATLTTNTTTAPNGTLTADTLIDNSTNSFHGLTSNGTESITVGLSYVGSIYAKYNGRNIQLTFDTANLGSGYANFDLQNGVLGNVSGGSATITNVGNGWYRCTFTTIALSTGNGAKLYPILIDSLSATRASSYIGNGTSGAYIWGAQLELGSTATTYQPISTTQQSYISNQFKYNLVNPIDSDAAFRLVFNGGWTMSAQGATPNGTNGYMDTKFVPASNLTINDQSYSVYSRTNTAAGDKRELGVNYFGETSVIAKFTGDLFYPIIGGGIYPNVSNTDSRGHYIANRTDATNIKGYKNGSLVLTYPQTPALPTTYGIYIGCRNDNGVANQYTDRQLAFSHLGQGLTNSEATALYNAVNQFQVTLNRAV